MRMITALILIAPYCSYGSLRIRKDGRFIRSEDSSGQNRYHFHGKCSIFCFAWCDVLNLNCPNYLTFCCKEDNSPRLLHSVIVRKRWIHWVWSVCTTDESCVVLNFLIHYLYLTPGRISSFSIKTPVETLLFTYWYDGKIGGMKEAAC